jgi:hypothetical protein
VEKQQNVREKLVELLAQYFTIGDSYAYNLTRVKEAFSVGTMTIDDFVEFDDETVEDIADNLIANGVTFAEDINVPTKWISVKDRLPTVADGKSLCEIVLAYINNGKIVGQVCTGWLNGNKWYLTVGEDDHYTVWGLGAVTHWMPLPQPPKGE